MITIGSVGSAHHMREICTVTRGVDLFLFFLNPVHGPNGISQLDHNASIDADFLKEVPFRGVEICKENSAGHICPPKLKIFLTIAKA
jgi:hypothetical protein